MTTIRHFCFLRHCSPSEVSPWLGYFGPNILLANENRAALKERDSDRIGPKLPPFHRARTKSQASRRMGMASLHRWCSADLWFRAHLRLRRTGCERSEL